jgi:hypothetical protein
MQLMNNGCNKFKVNDSTQVQLLLIVQEMWKNSLTYSSINVKHYVVVCVLIYTNKFNMQHLNNSFNYSKVDDSIRVHMLTIEKVKKFINSF